MKMRVIPTKVHGALDYVTAPALVAAPELLRLDGAKGSTVPPRASGAAAAVYSALTDYELGVKRAIPMRVHVLLDAVGGTVVALTPWLSGSARRGARHWLPHALVGLTEVGLALTTKTDAPPKGIRRIASAVGAMPRGRRLALLGVGVPLLAYGAYAGRRRLWQALALAADAVEEVADTIEDAAEDLGDAAKERAGNREDDD